MLESAFHEAIRSGDVTARLIYADWLEEQDRLVESAMLRSGRWCLIPAGTLWMGGGGGVAGAMKVVLTGVFYLGKYPVTQREWQELMGNNPSHFSRHGPGSTKVKKIRDESLRDFPVEDVSWDDARRYIDQCNDGEKDKTWVFRLPSEVEWEYACRGAPTIPEECAHHFYFSKPTNDLSATEANFDGRFPAGAASKSIRLSRPSQVGLYPPNRLGLHDLHGNVWEWCEDSYAGRPATAGSTGVRFAGRPTGPKADWPLIMSASVRFESRLAMREIPSQLSPDL